MDVSAHLFPLKLIRKGKGLMKMRVECWKWQKSFVLLFEKKAKAGKCTFGKTIFKVSTRKREIKFACKVYTSRSCEACA